MTSVLVYAGRCPKCRFLSRVIVALSLGSIVREPLDRAEAERFYYLEHPEARGLPALITDGELAFGWSVVPATFRALARQWLTRLRGKR